MLAVVVMVPADAACDVARVQVHRRKIVEQHQPNVTIKIPLEYGIARVVVQVVEDNVGCIPASVLDHPGLGGCAALQQLCAHRVVSRCCTEAGAAGQRRNAFLGESDDRIALDDAVNAWNAQGALPQAQRRVYAQVPADLREPPPCAPSQSAATSADGDRSIRRRSSLRPKSCECKSIKNTGQCSFWNGASSK